MARKQTYICLFVFGLLYSFTCKMSLGGKLTPQKFVAYVAQNEAKISKKQASNGVVYELKYVPTDLLFLNYMKGNKYTKKEYTTFQKENQGTSTFQFRISTPQNGSIEFLKHPIQNGKSYEERVKYYSFELQKDILLTDSDGNKYACTGYVFERNFGIQPYGIIHLVFPIDVSKKQVRVSINDNGIASNQVQFDFAKKDLQFPKMKYTKQ
jgi:hypothetical protein